MWSQIAVSLQNGNFYLILIIILSFLGLTILFERLIMLNFVYHLDFKKFLNNLKRSLQAEDIDRAISICKNASNTSLPSISLRAIEASERDPNTVRGVIEEETIDFLPKLETRIGSLPALATLVLLLGVLGTIDGLWDAFNSIEILDTTEKQTRLSNGIAGSLNPTSLGLMVCMIFLFGHYILKGLAIRLTDRIHYGVSVLVHLLVPDTPTAVIAAPTAAQAISRTDPTPEPSQSTNKPEKESDPIAEDDDDSFDDASVEDIKDEEEII